MSYNPTKDDPQRLPPREHTMFQKLIKYYDSKQFNPALAEARAILKKFPDHGETISMKALVTWAMGKKDEAEKLATQGLRANFKSATCWHVIGILEAKKKNYLKAMKSHQSALKQEPTNFIVLRDLAGIQHVLRMFKEYRQTRSDIIPLKSATNMSWTSFAIANYHCGVTPEVDHEGNLKDGKPDLNVSIEVLNMMADTMKKVKNEKQKDSGYYYDISEIYLFMAYVICLKEDWQEAIDHLNTFESDIVDIVAYHELKGRLYLKVNDFKQAEREYTWLLHRNPDNLHYYQAFEYLIKPDGVENRLKMYDILNAAFPRCLIGKRQILKFLPVDHAEYRARLHDYLLTGVIKGRPALFQDIKPLYSEPAKVKLIESIMLELAEDSELIPSAYPWVCYFLVKHFLRLQNYESAMKYADLGIEHTPTLVELYVVKAKVYRKSKNSAKAVEFITEAQALDTADRFTNCLACKYLITDYKIKEAESMLNKFVKETQDISDYLRELQVLWFETEVIKICYDNKNYGECLRRCHLVKRIFNDMFEDQFDFVQYCLRKMTISSFAEFLTFEDGLFSHQIYQIAAFYASKIYFQLLSGDSKLVDQIKNSITQEQRDESQEIIKKQEALEAKIIDEDGWGPKKENILDPVELIEKNDPITELSGFLDNLEKQAGKSTLTYFIGLRFYLGQKNYMKATRAAYQGLKSLNDRREAASREKNSGAYQTEAHVVATSVRKINENLESHLFNSEGLLGEFGKIFQ